MKILIIILSLFAIAFSQSGYNQRTVKSIFYDQYSADYTSVPIDSIKITGSNLYYTINTIAGQADSARSLGIPKGKVECAQTIYAHLKSISGTPKVIIYYGVWRGSPLGWSWTKLDSLTSDGDYSEIDISDSNVLSWGRSRIVNTWGIKFIESGNQSNRIWFKVVEKEPK